MKQKNIQRMCGSISIIIALVFSISTNSYAALLGWDLVDSGKHLDWDGNTKYTTRVTSAISKWEGYKPGIIRPDSIYVIQDVFISDFYEVSNVVGVTSAAGTIKFNDYWFNIYDPDYELNTVIHEFGHALGLAHTSGTNDVMRQGPYNIINLSSTDKSSYDAAYLTY